MIMKQPIVSAVPIWPNLTSSASRRTLYGLGVVIALLFLHAARLTTDTHQNVTMYLPVVSGAVLALCWAGAEFRLYLDRVVAEHERRDEALRERQRLFNQMWQALADHRGNETLPETVLAHLEQLFGADLVAVWSATDDRRAFQLRGVHPGDAAVAHRLTKVAYVSPCFDCLAEKKQILRMDDYAARTSAALSWFCQEHQLPYLVLCPILVRQHLVGVLALFYRAKPPLAARVAEEMQSAANLFLCAL